MGTVVAIGGIFVEDSALRPLNTRIDEIAHEFGVPNGDELKWSPRKGSWIYDNLHAETRTACNMKVLQAAVEHNVRGIVICWDTGQTTLKGERAFNKCVDFLFERIAVHLEKETRPLFLSQTVLAGVKIKRNNFSVIL